MSTSPRKPLRISTNLAPPSRLFGSVSTPKGDSGFESPRLPPPLPQTFTPPASHFPRPKNNNNRLSSSQNASVSFGTSKLTRAGSIAAGSGRRISPNDVMNFVPSTPSKETFRQQVSEKLR